MTRSTRARGAKLYANFYTSTRVHVHTLNLHAHTAACGGSVAYAGWGSWGLLAFLECLQKSEAKPWTLHIVIQATTENLKTWKERHIISDKYKRQSVKRNSRTCDFTVFTLQLG